MSLLESQFLIEDSCRLTAPASIIAGYSTLFRKLQSVDFNPNSVECEKFNGEMKKVISYLSNAQKANAVELVKANRIKALSYQRMIDDHLSAKSNGISTSKTLLSSNYSLVVPVSANIPPEVHIAVSLFHLLH